MSKRTPTFMTQNRINQTHLGVNEQNEGTVDCSLQCHVGHVPAPGGGCLPIPVGFLKKDHGPLIRKLQEQLALGPCPSGTGVGEPPRVPGHSIAGPGDPGAPDPVLDTLGGGAG
jgi:hypothetical protein